MGHEEDITAFTKTFLPSGACLPEFKNLQKWLNVSFA